MGTNKCTDNCRANNQSYFYSEIMLRKHFFNFSFYLYFGLCWLFIAVNGLPLIAAIRGYSPVVVLRLLIAVASLAAEHRLSAHGLQ